MADIKTVVILCFMFMGFCYQLVETNVCTGYDEVDVTDGENVTLRCNATKTSDIIQFVWQIPHNHSYVGQNVTVENAKETDIGLYICYAQTLSSYFEVNTICVYVYEQAVIKWVNETTPSLVEGQDFNMEFEVEGRPDPITVLINIKTGDILSLVTGSGTHNVTIKNVTCVASGQYRLTASNTYGNDSRIIDITVLGPAKLDPKYPIVQTHSPRIGHTAIFDAHVLGCPAPTFNWVHNNQTIAYTSNVSYTATHIQVISFEDFGVYELDIENKDGRDQANFTLLAEGPPDTPSDFSVKEVTISNATLSWVTGYDYEQKQTFVIYRNLEAGPEVFYQEVDTSDGHGQTVLTHEISNLTTNSLYNLTIVSRNADGNSTSSDFLVFSSYGKPTKDPNKDVTFIVETRLYERVSFEMHAIGYPPPSYTWMHDGQKLNSSDQTYSSKVTITSMSVADYGNYTLTMTSEAGNSTYTFFIAAYGPPESPTNFTTVDVGATNITLFWVSGYDYNETQTFVIDRIADGKISEFRTYPDESGGHGNTNITKTIDGLNEATEYNLTIFARNKNGSSDVSSYLPFMTYETPKMDPKRQEPLKFTPRTKETVKLVMHAVGNPTPTFTWVHGGVKLNSSDENSTSTVTIDKVRVEDFGNYTLTMSNKVGSSVYTYVLEADGPPDPVSNISYNELQNTSATLSWVSGFDYDSNQTFFVYNYLEGVMNKIAELTDNSSDPGERHLQLAVHDLSPSTFYNITVMSKNEKGATNATQFTMFTTFGKPTTDPKIPVNDTTSPRLGETRIFTMNWLANPVPSFLWIHNGTSLNHSDTGINTSIEIKDIVVKSFGTYILTMNNSYGVYTHTFYMKADGPPAPITYLNCTHVTDSDVSLKFMPGFNYNNTQTFAILVQSDDNKWIEKEDKIKDETDGHGVGMQTYTLKSLTENTLYTILMQSTNVNGSTNSSGTLSFRTTASPSKGPDSHTAEVAGGVAGGVAALILIIIIVVVVKCMRRRSLEEEETINEQTAEKMEPHMYRYDDASLSTGKS